MSKLSLAVSALLSSVILAGCVSPSTATSPETQAAQANETAEQFVARINSEIVERGRESEAAYWVYATYITPDTEVLVSKASERDLAFASEMLKGANLYDENKLSGDTARAIKSIKLGSSMPAPDDAAKRAEIAQLSAKLEGIYGKGKYCKTPESCQDLSELSRTIATSRDYDELLEAWSGWRTISPEMRPMYTRFTELMNEGSRQMGFADTSVVWRSGYDMSVDEFDKETVRLWDQVKPLYEDLHCYVRDKLADHYGESKVPRDQAIPAHLLGNMWAQSWADIYDLLEPYPGVLNLDVTSTLKEGNFTPVQMTKMAEGFFTSMGLPELPDSFYKNSLLEKPRDRDVVCHASAWPMGNGDDVRIKQCIEQTEESLTTIHHELGHIYYFLMQKELPALFKSGAHDGFHEAIGDTVVLSMTPDYLKSLNLVNDVSVSEQAVINQQMKVALERVAFLPFGKMIDEWRWRVFSGEIPASEYNKGWWDLRERYQGVRAPVTRTEADFDPGAKYHIPGNTPYTRYFLAHILQFQFHKSLCETSGHTGPLHECSIYGSKAAGERLGNMLAMGSSRPWQDAMQAVTGQRNMDGSAILDYFAPLQAWLKEQNTGKTCGW